MPFEHFLDLARVDVFSAAHEHVVHAPHKIIEPRLVPTHDIARDVPATDEPAAGLLRSIQVAWCHRATADPEFSFIRAAAIAQLHFDLVQRISQGKPRPDQPARMGPEVERAGLGRPPPVGYDGVRKYAGQALKQRLGDWRRPGFDARHPSEIELSQQIGFPAREGKHRRHCRDHVTAQARGDLEVLACIELAKHHVRAAHRRCQQALDHGVHVIQRRGEERPFAEERRRYAGERADDPDVAAMRERYALG